MSNSTAQATLASALAVLIQRRNTTVDPDEKTAISAEITGINDSIAALDQADLLAAAGLVSRAADGLERLVGAARLGPFDKYLSDLSRLIDGLQQEVSRMRGKDKPAPPPAQSNPAPTTKR